MGAQNPCLMGRQSLLCHHPLIQWVCVRFAAKFLASLFARASHPVIAGDAIFTAMDIVGIEGAESWDSAGLVRYRSKRDLLEIASNPAFGEKHDYKVAALEKTIAFPITTRMNLGDPRLILGLLTIIGVLLARRS